MVALPYSLFKLVQGLSFPRRSNIFTFGTWEMNDFSSSQNIQERLELTTDLVIIPLLHEDFFHVLDLSKGKTHSFDVIVTAFDNQKLEQSLLGVDYTVISSFEGFYGLILDKVGPDSFIRNKIRNSLPIELDKEDFFLPLFNRELWNQRNSRVLFESPEGTVEFIVPAEFSLRRTSSDLLWMIESVLLSPWHEKYSTRWIPTRRPGKRPGLSFSGGVDSTAAMSLMPETTILFYMKRNFPSMIKHDNALHFLSILRKDGKNTVVVQSNHEKIRTNFNKNAGFSTDYACMAHLILLADHYDLDSAGTGMPLENSYFFHGSSVRDFSQSRFWKHYSPLFNYLGLSLYQPVSGCSEILTNKIVNEHNYSDLCSSCLRSPIIGEKCGNCWKCFRKNIFNNKPWQMSNEISTFLQKRPLKQGLATLSALQIIKQNGHEIPPEANDLKELLDFDLSFLSQYWPPYLSLLPEKYRSFTKMKIDSIASPMEHNLLDIDERILTGMRGE